MFGSYCFCIQKSLYPRADIFDVWCLIRFLCSDFISILTLCATFDALKSYSRFYSFFFLVKGASGHKTGIRRIYFKSIVSKEQVLSTSSIDFFNKIWQPIANERFPHLTRPLLIKINDYITSIPLFKQTLACSLFNKKHAGFLFPLSLSISQ